MPTLPRPPTAPKFCRFQSNQLPPNFRLLLPPPPKFKSVPLLLLLVSHSLITLLSPPTTHPPSHPSRLHPLQPFTQPFKAQHSATVIGCFIACHFTLTSPPSLFCNPCGISPSRISLMASPPDFATLPYAQRLEAILRALQLPNDIDLGKYKRNSDWRIVWQEQEGFVLMTTDQSLQLVRQLLQHNNVTHLNLNGNWRIGCEHISAALRELTGLQKLDLGGTCLHACGCCGAWGVG